MGVKRVGFFVKRKARVRAAGLLLLCFVLCGRPARAREQTASFFIDLREFPLYVKAGFEPTDVFRSPDPDSGEWKVIPPSKSAVNVKNLGLGEKPRRFFLSPKGAGTREYTFVIPFAIDEARLGMIRLESSPEPGAVLAGIGDNWEIYFNGRLVRREMHLDDAGNIASHRSMRKITFPLAKHVFKSGENILALRIAGDPDDTTTGFFYATPYRIDGYLDIVRQNDSVITLMLIAVYIFMGVYHFFLFTLRKKDRYNLYYGLFSLFLGIHFLCRAPEIYRFIPDTAITFRIEYFTVFLLLPTGAFFFEKFVMGRVFRLTKIYAVPFAVLAVTQLLFSSAYREDALRVWNILALAVAPVIFVRDICYFFVLAAQDLRRQYAEKGTPCSLVSLPFRTLIATPFGNIVLGALISFATGVYDVIDSLALHKGLALTQYGFFIFTVATALILARRTAHLYNLQERIIVRSNKCINPRMVDWIAVQDRDPWEMPSATENKAIMFTDIRDFANLSEKMASHTLTGFLNALNETLSVPMFDAEDRGVSAYTDKFIGDGVMNIFDSPDAALRDAVELRSRLRQFNRDPRRFFKDADADMRIDVGVGIAYGPVTLGVMGHSRRIDYTPIGDTVNVASRLESLTKEYHTPVLINDALFDAVNPSSFCLRHIDRIRIKGKDRPVDIYEEFSADAPHVRAVKEKLAPRFREIQELYFSGRNWERAVRFAEAYIRYFEQALRRYGGAAPEAADYVMGVYLERMKSIRADPAILSHWDGVYTFTKK